MKRENIQKNNTNSGKGDIISFWKQILFRCFLNDQVKTSHLCIISFTKKIAYWKNSIPYYKIMAEKQLELGTIGEHHLTEAFKRFNECFIFHISPVEETFLSTVYSWKPGKKLKINCLLLDKKTTEGPCYSCRLIYIIQLFTQNMGRWLKFVLSLCFLTVCLCEYNICV